MINLFFLLLFPLFDNLKFSDNKIDPSKVNLKEFSFTNQQLQMDEIRFQQDNISYYYKRNEFSQSNINFDNDYIIFYENGTGKYHQTDGKEYKVNWENVLKDRIKFTISDFRNKKDLIVIWDKIRIEGKKVYYTEFYTHANRVKSLAIAIRAVTEPNLEYVSK